MDTEAGLGAQPSVYFPFLRQRLFLFRRGIVRLLLKFSPPLSSCGHFDVAPFGREGAPKSDAQYGTSNQYTHDLDGGRWGEDGDQQNRSREHGSQDLPDPLILSVISLNADLLLPCLLTFDTLLGIGLDVSQFHFVIALDQSRKIRSGQLPGVNVGVAKVKVEVDRKVLNTDRVMRRG